MTEDKNFPTSRLDAAKRLKEILSEHRGRMDITLSVAIDAAKSLSELFHEYAEKELRDIREEMNLMKAAGDELNEEEESLEDIDKNYEVTDEKLKKLLERAKNKSIKSIADFDFSLVGSAYTLVEEIYELREKIDRNSRNFIRNSDAIMQMLDGYLKEKGLLK